MKHTTSTATAPITTAPITTSSSTSTGTSTATAPVVNNNIRVRPRRPVVRVVTSSLVINLALLVVREVLPQVAAQLPAVYTFLDKVEIPIVEWMYRLGIKLISLMLNQEWFAKIVEFFAGLAA